jgi:environmental stress-induced protein Ves
MPIDIENDEVARIIAENYLKVPDESGQFDVNKDFSTAAKVAANKMLSQFPSIDRTTESFKNAMNVLNDPKHEHDHIKEYKAIKFLFEKISSEK